MRKEMEVLCLYILFAATLKLSSANIYNLEGEADSSFACYTDQFTNDTEKPKAIKLFLSRSNLKITCHLYDFDKVDSKENRRKNLLLYTSAGLSPSIQIFNTTYSKVFYFNKTLGEDVDSWAIDIRREEIAYNTDINPIEQWFVKFNMHHGLNMFTSEGTLLDTIREPILQWKLLLGDPVDIEPSMPQVADVTVTKSPCASDAALIGLIYKTSVTGIVIGMTETGFMTRDTMWYNLTNSICAVIDYDCSGLGLVNMILINTRLILLTTLGLFISQDLRDKTGQLLTFSKPTLCGFEMDDYLRAKIWYTRQCLANRESYEADFVGLSFNKEKTLSQESTCFYSNDSFTKWHSCLPHRPRTEKQISRLVVSFIVDYEQNTGIAVLLQQNRALITVYKLTNGEMHKKKKFPTFSLQDRTFKPVGMFFHPDSHFLYLYGNQVYISYDGGNTFIGLLRLTDEIIIETDACVYTQGIVFVTDKGNIYYTKAGLFIYSRLETAFKNVFSSYFDHLGMLSQIGLNASSEDKLVVNALDVKALLKKDDIGFQGALAPQFITEEQMLFLYHEPLRGGVPVKRFSHLHVGKSLTFGPGGSAIIYDILRNPDLPKFVSGILVDVLERFPVESKTDSPCTANTLTILEPDAGTIAYKLKLSTPGADIFKATDIEKTVVIPGSSSFFISSITDGLTALGHATMPNRVLLNEEIPSGKWFLYDFGTTSGRKWKVVADACRYVIQQLDNLSIHAIRYLDLGETMYFAFRITPVNVAYQVFHRYLLRLMVGNPNLLDVTINDYWDDTDSYVMEVTAKSRFFEQGKTSLALVAVYASLLCDVTTIVITLKSSCSYLKMMHHVLPVQISVSEWLSEDFTGERNTSSISKHLKTLPINYRPPSVLGIAVPLTDNFYHADPSKPRMRDYFTGSKKSGKYKQCANKTNRGQCQCTKNMKLSFSVAFSDCKEKALRMKFPVTRLPLFFTVEDEGVSRNLTSPYYITITEVNNRTNWEVSGTNNTSSTLKMKKHLEDKLKTQLYNPDGLAITITGSELFHFRVSTIPGVSFCNLFDEFQIYVDDSPLAFPGQYLISTIAAVLIGGIIFAAFILNVYEIHMGSIFTLRWKTNKVASKPSVISASEGSTESSEGTYERKTSQ